MGVWFMETRGGLIRLTAPNGVEVFAVTAGTALMLSDMLREEAGLLEWDVDEYDVDEWDVDE